MRGQLASACLFLAQIVHAFTPLQFSTHGYGAFDTKVSARSHDPDAENVAVNSRRKVLAGVGSILSAGFLLPAEIVRADSEADLTSQMFNADGSLKGEVEEVKFRTVEIAWGTGSDNYLVNVDGANAASTESGSQVRLSYKLPDKWQQKEDGYYDKSTSDLSKACQRISVYRAPGKVPAERLAKAATIGIAEALYVTDALKALKGADLISGRTRAQGDVKFYDFDMAVAPKTCGDSKENLGLGFCPFDTIYLLSAAVVDESLYVMAVECDKSEWKVANSDLKRVRSSFAIDV